MMFDEIRKCKKCALYKNQQPIIDKKNKCKVMWVGLSAKKIKSSEETPLSSETNSGKLIKKIEELCKDVPTYKTNLVKCLPLTECQKLRYPTKSEMNCCFENLMYEIDILKPKIIFLLGERVYSCIEKQLNVRFEKWNDFDYCYKEYKQVYFVPVQHPSYIYVYKKKYINEYIRGIKKIINELL